MSDSQARIARRADRKAASKARGRRKTTKEVVAKIARRTQREDREDTYLPRSERKALRVEPVHAVLADALAQDAVMEPEAADSDLPELAPGMTVSLKDGAVVYTDQPDGGFLVRPDVWKDLARVTGQAASTGI